MIRLTSKLGRRVSKQAQAGFTIIELMIATVAFSLILIGITVGVISFTNSYYAGVNATTTQTTTRAALDAVTQAIQFSGGDLNYYAAAPGDQPTTYCIGSTQFDISLGNLVGPGHGLYQTPRNNGDPCTHKSFGSKSTELLGQNMRLFSLNLTPQPDSDVQLYTVDISVGLGIGPDLFCDSSVNGTGGCDRSDATFDEAALQTHITTSQPEVGQSMRCRLGTGSQFCNVTTLSTAAQKRIQ